MIRHSIRTRLMALVLLATIVPSGISITFSYLYTKNSVTDQSVKQNTKLLNLGQSNLSNYFDDLNRRVMSVYSGINVPGSFYTALLVAKGPEAYTDGSAAPDNRAIITTQLYNLFLSDQNSYQIHLFIRANQQSNMLLGGQFRREINEDYKAMENPDGTRRPFIEATHMNHQYGLKSAFVTKKSGTEPVFSAHFPIYRTPSPEIMADLSIDFQIAGLETIAKSMYNSETERLYILNKQGDALYASDPDWIGQPVRAGWSVLPAGKEDGSFTWHDKAFEGIVMFRHIDSTLFQGAIIKLIPFGDLYSDARTITRITAGIGVIFLIIGGMAAVLISIGFTRPIKKLISFTQKVQIGQLDAQMEVEREDEFGLLTRKITGMTQTINNLVVKEYRLEIANKTNQLKALQAQVNPHFLYNALQSIATLSLRYNAPKVYDLIYSLGSMMRYSMNTERVLVTLQDELEHVQNYMRLQTERFGEEELRLEVEIEEEAKEAVVPKMILQPIVENVFKHGFADGIRQGVIMICCHVDDSDRLVIAVSDNGVGMSAERMAETEYGLKHMDRPEQEEIGLRNVLARLRLQISREAQLVLRNNDSGGITVEFIIPPGDNGSQKNWKGDAEE